MREEVGKKAFIIRDHGIVVCGRRKEDAETASRRAYTLTTVSNNCNKGKVGAENVDLCLGT